MKKSLFLLTLLCVVKFAFSQFSSQQLLRLHNIATLADLNAIAAPQAGHLVFVMSESTTYQYNGTDWLAFTGSSNSLIDQDGDTWISVDDGNDNDVIDFTLFDTTYFRMDKRKIEFLNSEGSVFIGQQTGSQGEGNVAIGNSVLISSTSQSSQNIALGSSALPNLTWGVGNIAMGHESLNKSSGTYDNIALGRFSLSNEEFGSDNIAIGFASMKYGTGNDYNIALGAFTFSNLNNNSTYRNVAVGYSSFRYSKQGSDNIGIGFNALANNESDNNTVVGANAMYSNSYGSKNVSVGFGNLIDNKTGSNNSSFGAHSMEENITGSSNTSFGYLAMSSCTACDANAAFGYQALYSNKGGGNAVFGTNALYDNVDGYLNSAFGHNALLTCLGRNNTGIGSNAQVAIDSGNNQVRIGNSLVSHAAIQVSWSTSSDLHWKENVRDLPYGLNLISKLRSVDYIRKNASERGREVGFIAQELVKVLQEVGFDEQGFLTQTDKGHYEVRYNDFIPIAIKGIQEQQKQIQEQQKQIVELDSKYNQLAERLNKIETSSY